MREPTLVVTNERWSRDTYVIFSDEKEELIDELFDENAAVVRFWPKRGVCQTYENGEFNYYRYDNDGIASYITKGTIKDLIQYLKS